MPINLEDKMLAIYGFAGTLVSSLFFSPAKYMWVAPTAVLGLGSLGLFLKSRWVSSTPNEWLLVIRNGLCIKAGVGLKTFLGPVDSFVKFPSKVEQVSFTANNVTREMQGVVISGFAFWSVYRGEDGPFRCYKYMEGGDANRNVQAMCESSLRNLIANSSLDDVIKNRNHLRLKMKNDLEAQLKGWGIWLETVEITQVIISSERLFKDLQAEFRQETHMKAEQIELNSQQRMNETKQTTELKMAEANELNQTKKLVTRNGEKIRRENEQASYDNKKNDLELKRISRESDFQIKKMKTDLLQEQEKLNNEQILSTTKQAFELSYLRSKIDLDKLHDEKTLQKYQIDATERIYGRLGIKEIRINQFVGDSTSNLGSLLPQMSSISKPVA